MNQLPYYLGADFARAKPVLPNEGRRDNPASEREMRRRDVPRAPARVPMLDWPAQLFNDNPGVQDLVAEDYAAVSLGREFYAQAAA